MQMAVCAKKGRCWAIGAFALQTGLLPARLNGDNNSIEVLSPKRPVWKTNYHFPESHKPITRANAPIAQHRPCSCHSTAVASYRADRS
jgi:hypothetical protein